MVRKVRCENGHWYDAEKYQECPHCAKEGKIPETADAAKPEREDEVIILSPKKKRGWFWKKRKNRRADGDFLEKTEAFSDITEKDSNLEDPFFTGSRLRRRMRRMTSGAVNSLLRRKNNPPLMRMQKRIPRKRWPIMELQTRNLWWDGWCASKGFTLVRSFGSKPGEISWGDPSPWISVSWMTPRYPGRSMQFSRLTLALPPLEFSQVRVEI